MGPSLANLPYVYPSRKKCFSLHWAWWLWHSPLCQVIIRKKPLRAQITTVNHRRLDLLSYLTTPLPQPWKATANNHHPRPQTDSKLDNQTTQQRKIWQEMRPGHCSARPTTLPPVPLVTRNQSSSPHPVLAKGLQHHQPQTRQHQLGRHYAAKPDLPRHKLTHRYRRPRKNWLDRQG